MSTTHPTPRVGARRHAAASPSGRRRGALVALTLAVIAVALALDVAREAAADWLFRLALTVTGGTGVGMTSAGWLTFALVPLAAVVLDRDHRRRFRAVDMSDTMQFVRREKAGRGHQVARRPFSWWLRRSPLFAILALGVINLPLSFGHRSDLGVSWRATPGGPAYLSGWHWSLVAAVGSLALVTLAPLAAAFRKRRARAGSLTPLYVVAATLPLAALVVALV